jgi:hypothetical protein
MGVRATAVRALVVAVFDSVAGADGEPCAWSCSVTDTLSRARIHADSRDEAPSHHTGGVDDEKRPLARALVLAMDAVLARHRSLGLERSV